MQLKMEDNSPKKENILKVGIAEADRLDDMVRSFRLMNKNSNRRRFVVSRENVVDGHGNIIVEKAKDIDISVVKQFQRSFDRNTEFKVFSSDEGIAIMRDLNLAAELASRAAVQIPDQSAQMLELIKSYEKSDLFELGQALEKYKVDHGAFPAMRPIQELCSKPEALKKTNGWDLYTIEPGKQGLEGLTTPQEYIDSIMPDLFSKGKSWY